ncbi:transformation/transcription domain-associated protein [Monoraphidium neglectum]|uniref:Transformation/transcription domain-associated protein n=1 Tax=Monoraphidium neglectum TaxID=145388 RepID=A0A0D2KIS2_9CHLO|nr:transformation/transcription domain-associated protein [Monoraphidium neglectum]KIY95658.1 transformation/transcription domain-associated protein [Monoraphidium neglectum]|eukprot:XP_013894678.1 transformation/transcription domain-associated protein [Monoraphidium neglectum]
MRLWGRRSLEAASRAAEPLPMRCALAKQAMLEAISLSQPQPKVPPELLRFLGKTFCVWQHAVPLLESHTVIFPDETRCFDSLAEMYRLLHEEDAFYGAWRKRCEEPKTRAALSLAQHGQWAGSQNLLGELNQAVSSGAALPSRGEGALWVDQWVNAAKQLNQWDALQEYALAADNNALLADCYWRLSEWDRLRDVLVGGGATHTNKQMTIEPSPQSCLIRTYAALQALDMNSAEQHINAGFQHVLHKWWQLPEQPWSSAAHCVLLQQMQQLVELKESVRPDHAYGDVKDILETWRLRLPNEWDPLLHWQDVLVWRNTVYNVVISAFNKIQVPSHMHQMGYRDKAWSVNRLGTVAAKHGCPELCINVVNNMYGYSAMEVQEAFVKIREQAKAYLAMKDELGAGLNMLNTTNLDYFGAHHQAEIFRLKGVFLQELNDPEAANAALATSLMLWRTCPEAWVSWGQACDAAYERQPAGPQAARYLQYAAHCYLQGVRLGSEEARDLIPRLLLLLSFDDVDGVVGAELQKVVAAGDVPSWVWFTWIPQLLTSLSRPEAPRVKPILKELAQHHPQSVYYWTRVLIISSRQQ